LPVIDLPGANLSRASPTSVPAIYRQPAITVTIYEQEVMRSNDCGKIYEALLPAGVSPKRYDETADVAIAINKAELGTPYNRSAALQRDCGMPLSESVMAERCEAVAEALFPIYKEMRRRAADGKVFYGDDMDIERPRALYFQQISCEESRLRFALDVMAIQRNYRKCDKRRPRSLASASASRRRGTLSLASGSQWFVTAVAKATHDGTINTWKSNPFAEREFRTSGHAGFGGATQRKISRLASKPNPNSAATLSPRVEKVEKGAGNVKERIESLNTISSSQSDLIESQASGERCPKSNHKPY
jgi:hypothetical protein